MLIGYPEIWKKTISEFLKEVRMKDSKAEDEAAVNDNGQIVGDGTNPFGQTRAFLLTPVPEPTLTALLVLGGVLPLSKRTRQHRCSHA
jgi:hypothetical protein